MRIRFWGTRGSIPVALTSVDIRDKLALALLEASGRRFDTYEEAHDFASSELDFSVTNTFERDLHVIWHRGQRLLYVSACVLNATLQ